MQQLTSSPLWRNWFIALAAGGVLVNLLGLHSSILEPDGALYAGIAKRMAESGDWINLYAHNRDWLDKPHFPFWMTAASYSVFGINAIAYKLPALFFWAMGGWYTYRLARRLYSEPVAQVALLIYLTALHLVISNNDVRAEPYLTGLFAGAVYHWRCSKGWHGWWIGALFMAAAIMTKGIFILIPVVAGFLLHWWINGQLKEALTNPGWWFALGLTGLFILPELICLYLQFDRHPEKLVFGRTGVSGIRFFFWDSQFGRFLNTGPIKGKGDPFFFLHTLLWAFLPWSILLYSSLADRLRALFRREKGEWVLTGISLSCFLLFSASRFQLPHYMNIVFPFFAILTANWLCQLKTGEKWLNRFSRVQMGISLLLLAGCVGLWALMYATNFRPLVYLLAMTAGWILLWTRSAKFGVGQLQRLILSTSLAACTLYGFLNIYFYPAILRYQSGEQAAGWLNQHRKGEAIYTINPYSYSLDFYSAAPVLYTERANLLAIAKKKPVLLYTSRQQMDSLLSEKAAVDVIDSFAHYPISKLKIGFLLPHKRPRYLDYRYLLEVRSE
ncbi:glycosyltransferase family 39 protein [Flavihumibacter sp. CACIAM 22H1]|uniref:ArnT family glycosyltransferase n=1 Tax=Flavihumibacter sp. CACIAM 22H1 TaxID=1812911 RepID=UPI000B20984E|nr:glycosyltransferase family 39 protein [Flavihumibacter sp. CACIAM 22H1]